MNETILTFLIKQGTISIQLTETLFSFSCFNITLELKLDHKTRVVMELYNMEISPSAKLDHADLVGIMG